MNLGIGTGEKGACGVIDVDFDQQRTRLLDPIAEMSGFFNAHSGGSPNVKLESAAIDIGEEVPAEPRDSRVLSLRASSEAVDVTLNPVFPATGACHAPDFKKATPLTTQELNGYNLFRGKAQCNTCHLDGRSNTASGGRHGSPNRRPTDVYCGKLRDGQARHCNRRFLFAKWPWPRARLS